MNETRYTGKLPVWPIAILAAIFLTGYCTRAHAQQKSQPQQGAAWTKH
jgi:hypothetical protein